MLSKNRTMLALLILVSLSSAGIAQPILDTTPAATGATKIFATTAIGHGELTDILTGAPASIPSVEARIQVPGGEVVWQPKRDWIDEQGFQHIHYRQRLFLNGPLGELVSARLTEEGIPLSGGSLKLHFYPDGSLFFVSGAHFDDVHIPTTIEIFDEISALSAAWQILQEQGIDMQNLNELPTDTVDRLLAQTQLKLASNGDGRTFSLLWQVVTKRTDGAVLAAAMDGATSELVHYWNPNPTSDCFIPESNNGVSANADPQNANVPDRSGLAATPVTGFIPQYEAHWPESSGAEVEIIGFWGTTSDSCSTESGVQEYELATLTTYNQAPYFGLPSGNSDVRQVVGDAMWKTQQTMEVFTDLGRDSFDGSGSTARIIADANCDSEYYGRASFQISESEWGPEDSVIFCPKLSPGSFFSPAASLDVVAHEWGHGIIADEAWPYNTPLRKTLSEGWADLIGHLVEQNTEPPGDGPEKADWKFDEDSYYTRRQVNVDDDDYDPNTGIGGPQSYHAEDPCDDDPHNCGMPIPVAFWLAADGETTNSEHDNLNPICQRNSSAIPAEVDCDLEVTPMGISKATEIFFKVLTEYVDYTDSWDDFAQYGKAAAYNLYADYPPCDNADFEQDVIQDAFTAIGYPGPNPSSRYCFAAGMCCFSK